MKPLGIWLVTGALAMLLPLGCSNPQGTAGPVDETNESNANSSDETSDDPVQTEIEVPRPAEQPAMSENVAPDVETREQEVELAVGQAVVIWLETNLTVTPPHYMAAAPQVEGDAEAVQLTVVEPAAESDDEGEPRVGGSTRFAWHVEATAPGTATVTIPTYWAGPAMVEGEPLTTPAVRLHITVTD